MIIKTIHIRIQNYNNYQLTSFKTKMKWIANDRNSILECIDGDENTHYNYLALYL